MESSTKVTVVGLVDGIDDVGFVADRDALPFIRLSPAFCEAHELHPSSPDSTCVFPGRASEGRFIRDVRDIQPGTVFFQTFRAQWPPAAQALRATLLMVPPVAPRCRGDRGTGAAPALRSEPSREQVLEAIGLTVGQRRATSMLLAAVTGGLAVLVAAGVMVAISPLAPRRPGRWLRARSGAVDRHRRARDARRGAPRLRVAHRVPGLRGARPTSRSAPAAPGR